jgi:hypothetical protein
MLQLTVVQAVVVADDLQLTEEQAAVLDYMGKVTTEQEHRYGVHRDQVV